MSKANTTIEPMTIIAIYRVVSSTKSMALSEMEADLALLGLLAVMMMFCV
jgi:hypothetical protein